MKKTSTYARKKAVQQRQDEHDSLLSLIKQDLRGLQIDAGIHTWTGNDGAKMVNLAGRLCYITAFAAQRAGFQADHPDVRIVRGMAEALADLSADLDIVLGCSELDTILAVKDLGTADVRLAMGVQA